MAFNYATLYEGLAPSVRTSVVTNSLATDTLYLRMIHLHNTDDVNSVEVSFYFVPNDGGVAGSWLPGHRRIVKSLGARTQETLEFPVPGIILAYNDRIEISADVADVCNITMSGGRDY